ncbi:hypothetical protein [Glaciimonas immobilis]|uniref:Uncharacterized protein n=1 Tax=Glaciimonas immobilis TaxID=728004 RepID=A0A840RK23_9BURK|nr:hypothetical protein [Glaciimonas immobilis]KAF3999112.1 hypothetical protein HAV38_03975 [Glaciimonas immobilis]MBB5198547.1 hypothetical protein [Glaciimonas immobilis]
MLSPDKQFEVLNYKGYTIVSQPTQGHDDLWHDGYQIIKGDTEIASRLNTESIHTTRDAARDSSLDFARIEVDNLVALDE